MRFRQREAMLLDERLPQKLGIVAVWATSGPGDPVSEVRYRRRIR
ncbi:hypothetical protein [Mycolicibacterium austroafricanum]|nr:hypothetical protein [Mycolicibacterium austroafricanum]